MSGTRHLELPRGFHDISPERTATYRALQHEWFEACSLSGYQPVMVPPVGFADSFTTGHHASGQRLYEFTDRRGRDLALVSDSLPTLLRLARRRNLPDQRLSYCCPVFRYERRPRRHFHHLGLMEMRERPSTLAEQVRSTSRLIALVSQFLVRRLTPTVTLFDPGLWYAMTACLHHVTAPSRFINLLRRHQPDQRPAQLREQHAPPVVVALAELIAADPALESLDDHARSLASLSPAIRARLDACQELAEFVSSHGAEVVVDHGELHASEFHDGPAFTVRSPAERRLLGDGGSYGRFARRFLGSPASASAAMIGLERLADLSTTDSPVPAADIAILAHPHHDTTNHAEKVSATLRAVHIKVWDLVIDKPLGQHFRDLAALSIPWSVIIGPNEIHGNQYVIRTIEGALHAIAQTELPTWLLNRQSARRITSGGYDVEQWNSP